MVRAAAKNHDAVTVVVDRPTTARARRARRGGGSVSLETRAGSPPRRSRTPRIRRGDRRLLRPRRPEACDRASSRDLLALQLRKRQTSLRREPAPAGGVLRRGRHAGRVATARPAAPGQGALLQQPRRCGRRARVRGQFDGARLRDRQARQPLRRRGRRDTLRAYDKAYPHRPDLRVRRHHRLQPAAGRELTARRSSSAVRRGPDRARRSSREAREACATKKNVRVLVTGALPPSTRSFDIRSVVGGLLVQTRDHGMSRRPR